MLKTIALAAATLVVAVGAASATPDANNDGKLTPVEIHQFYSQDGGEYQR